MKIIKLKNKTPQTPPSSSIQTVASIDHLLTLILLHLPIKSLTRFKLVSKHFHSLIAHPNFPLLLHPTPPPPTALLFPLPTPSRQNQTFKFIPLSTPTPPPFKHLSFTNDPQGITITHSCNGLMLCRSFRGHTASHRHYIYNPTTKMFSKLPKLEPQPGLSSRILGMSLAFDPAKSPHYKVVSVRALVLESDSDELQFQIFVYSSENGPWRECGEPFAAQVHFETGVHWRGAIHWISPKHGQDSLYFNPDDHDPTVKILPLPPIPRQWDWRSNYYFDESGGHLHYIEVLGSMNRFNVYEMKNDYSEWFVKYEVDLSAVIAAHPRMIRDYCDPGDWYYYAYSVFLHYDDFLVLKIPGKLIKYSVVDQTFEVLHEHDEDEEEKWCLEHPNSNGFQYIESLYCV
ncbi:F-box protein At5g07610-like [Andrographis paniculata]|uniref:F-box protein At5g07610-like n=1 Tax=Andrographis paniculata TaxID=175694 RepID=UPI0021E9A1D5|nr:F-box protein At5g07610-like [Andrographis paniculata]